jgi:tRNA threonylcarbamoyladenosine biosynthesis protein TsaE
MNKKLEREWKKVFESDLSYICYELKDLIETPALIILEGDLGAGKTTFCKSFLKDETFSPSYSILTDTPEALHGDFYRLKSSDEIVHLELPMYLQEKKYFFVEWGEKYAEDLYKELPDNYSCFMMKIEINNSDESHKENDQFSRNFFFHSLTFDY